MQQDVRKGLGGDGVPVHLHDVARAHPRVELARLAVHDDAAVADQLVGPSPRRDSGPGEVGVQAHRGIVSPVGCARVRDPGSDSGPA